MLKNLSLQNRLISSFLFIGLIVLVVALIGWNSSSRLNRHLNVFSGDTLPGASSLWKINEGQTQIQSAERLLFDPELTLAERQDALAQIANGWEQINAGIEQYEAIPTTNEKKGEKYDEFQQGLNKWKQAHQHLIEIEQEFNQLNVRNPWKREGELIKQGKENSPEMASVRAALALRAKMDSEGASKEEPLFISTDEDAANLLQLNDELAAITQKQAEQDLSRSLLWVVIGMAIGPLTAIVLGVVISRQIAKRVVDVVGVAEQVAAGNLTAEIKAGLSKKDEIDQLSNAFQTMTRNLNVLIGQVQQSGIQVTTSATKIAASGKQLEATVTEQVAATNEVVVTAKEIAATSGELSNTMEEVATVSQETTVAAAANQAGLLRMATTMRQLVAATNSISTKLEVISEKANNINSVVSTITKVADQTNLLSLNAAIEAEKAGEYGLGFSVVAREIRRLADQTAVATLDIEQMVKEMQSSVSTGVMEMDKFTKEVGRGVEDVGNISEQLGEIIGQVQALSPRFSIVNQGMEAQSQGAQQISEAMVQLSETSVQTADALQEINRAIEQLNQAAQGLRQEISRFKVGAIALEPQPLYS